MSNHYKFMLEAIEQAKLAMLIDEVPIGAVVVHNNVVVGRGYNRRECDKNALAHAEIIAINDACRNLSSWRLLECDLYVTLEPCPMCSGAIINSRIERVIYGAYDKKAGCHTSLINLFDYPFNHKPEVISGLMKEDCSQILSSFFKELRKRKQRKQHRF